MMERKERLQITVGRDCNNNCIFCIEDDREGRHERISKITKKDVFRMLDEKKDLREVIFTSGEPTLNPDLPSYIAYARKTGFRLIGIVTNGRRLSYPDYAARLIDAGLNSVMVSAHSTDKRVFESLTRSAGSYSQTMAALSNLSRLKEKKGFRLDVSYVVNRINLPGIKEDYRRFGRYDIDTIVYNPVIPRGRAGRLMKLLMVRYSDVVEKIAAITQEHARISLNDVPPCAGMKVKHRLGASEKAFVKYDGRYTTPNDSGRVKRELCRKCAYFGSCIGVYKEYLEHYGWEEFLPVR